MEDKSIKAVLDEDFQKLLKQLGVYDSVIQGKSVCAFCGEVVTLENIAMVFPEEGEVKFCCDKLECTKKLAKKGNQP